MKLVPVSVTRSIGRHILTTKKNSPHIFFAAGVVGVIGSTILACRATLKLEPVVDDIREDFRNVKAMGRPSETGHREDYPDRQYYADLGYVYGRSAKKIVRLYGPSAVLGVASIGALTGSHVQLTRRNSALTATIALVSQAYDDYRDRVRAEIGEERELDIYRNIEEETITKGGKKKIVKKLGGDPNKYSVYARVFDEYNVNYRPDAETNKNYLVCQQNYFNHRLQTYGHVFLNEVYDNLGFERTQAGSVVGWVLNDKGDNYIDFGMFDHDDNAFINGLESAIWLDFNVDGIMYNKIGAEI